MISYNNRAQIGMLFIMGGSVVPRASVQVNNAFAASVDKRRGGGRGVVSENIAAHADACGRAVSIRYVPPALVLSPLSESDPDPKRSSSDMAPRSLTHGGQRTQVFWLVLSPQMSSGFAAS